MPRVIGNLAGALFGGMMATYAFIGAWGLLEMGADHFFTAAKEELLPSTLMRGAFVLAVFFGCCRASWRLLNRLDAKKRR